jgi:AcrR family transcriptional regulator
MRKGPRAVKRRAEILRSATAAFRRRGYHGASVEEIARALGMTKGNLYYYFRDKEEILFFCHDYSLDILLKVLARTGRTRGTAEVKLRTLLAAFIHMIIDELHGTALTLDLQALSPRLLRRVIRKRDRFDRAIRRLVQEGMDQGLFARGDAKLLTFAMLGAVNWITRWYDPRGAASSDQIAATFADFLVRGLRPPGRAPARPRRPARAARPA